MIFLRTIFAALLFPLSLVASDLKLADPTFQSELGKAWHPYEFGDGGDIENLKVRATGLELQISGGGGGQGVFQDAPTTLTAGQVITISATGEVKDGLSITKGMGVGIHVEFLSGDQVIGRTDSLQSSIFVGVEQVEGKKFELTANHTAAASDVTAVSAGHSLADITAIRLVVVAIQLEGAAETADFGAIMIHEVALAVKS